MEISVYVKGGRATGKSRILTNITKLIEKDYDIENRIFSDITPNEEYLYLTFGVKDHE